MTEREAKFEQDFASRMEDCGYMNLKADHLKRGWSDRFFFGFKRKTVIVEFKRDGAPKKRKGEKMQDYFREEFRKRGYPVFKVTGRDEAEKLFHEITGEKM